jgi:hypothetical protein
MMTTPMVAQPTTDLTVSLALHEDRSVSVALANVFLILDFFTGEEAARYLDNIGGVDSPIADKECKVKLLHCDSSAHAQATLLHLAGEHLGMGA